MLSSSSSCFLWLKVSLPAAALRIDDNDESFGLPKKISSGRLLLSLRNKAGEGSPKFVANG